MNLSINANYLVCTRDPNHFRTAGECLALCRRAGFRTFDYSPYLDCDNWEESIDAVIRAADALDVELEQSHAPYNYYAKRTPEHFSVLLDRSVGGGDPDEEPPAGVPHGRISCAVSRCI